VFFCENVTVAGCEFIIMRFLNTSVWNEHLMWR